MESAGVMARKVLVQITATVLAIVHAAAQQPEEAGRPSTAKPDLRGSISGVIEDSVSHAPVSGARVMAILLRGESSQGASRTVNTDAGASGRYQFSGLVPGQYRIFVRSPDRFGPHGTRMVSLPPGGRLTSIDFSLRPYSSVSGRVLDENGEAVPDAIVHAVFRQYFHGALAYLVKSGVSTNDRGEYTLPFLEAGNSYLIRADKREPDPVSTAAADIKRRKPALARTYYPNAGSLEAAAPLILRAGERREGVDIRMPRLPSYCIEGRLEMDGQPSALDYDIAEGALRWSDFKVGGKAGPDGRIRICGLQPGEYEITANQGSPSNATSPPRFGTVTVHLVDKDVHGLKVEASRPVALAGSVIREGMQAGDPAGKLLIALEPARRMSFMGEQSDVTAPVPGDFSFPSLIADDYIVRLPKLPAPDVYVKDVRYGGSSIKNQILRLSSSAAASELSIVLATGGGRFTASVVDENRNPAGNSNVILMPAGQISEADFAARIITEQTDQTGCYSSPTIEPGIYYALAISGPPPVSPEGIGALMRLRASKGSKIEISPGGSSHVTLPLTALE